MTGAGQPGTLAVPPRRPEDRTAAGSQAKMKSAAEKLAALSVP